MKRPVKIMLILLGALLLLVLVVVVNLNRAQSTVRGIEVVINYGRMPRLVLEQTVRDSIMATLPALLNQSVGSVDRKQVVEGASKVPWIKDVSASVSVSGKVVVRARQRRPIARLYYGSKEYYFDADGYVMPASYTGSCNVLVAGGDFTEPLRVDSLNSQMESLLQLAKFLDREEKYGDLIDQVYIESDGDVMMVPKLGNHIVELGKVDDLSNKFSNLLTFYRKGMPRAGWNTYSRVSLKFKGQVICTKRDKSN